MAFTFFFRDYQILDLAVNHVVREMSGRSRIGVWDAGCAMGPEPFSLAIIFAERLGRFAFKNLRIDATDIDTSNLFERIIVEGTFPQQELDRIPRDIFDKYFEPAEREGFHRIDYGIRQRISFRRHDLLSLDPVGSDFSLILCKNVLLHFSPEERMNVIRMFHRSLAPGGFLAVEQTQKMPDELASFFEKATPEGQLFRRVEAA
jgi:chemotaxis protein methyltransferase CheR